MSDPENQSAQVEQEHCLQKDLEEKILQGISTIHECLREHKSPNVQGFNPIHLFLASETLNELCRYFSMFDAYNQDIVQALENLGSDLLTSFVSSPYFVLPQNTIFDLVLTLVNKNALPVSFIEQFHKHLSENGEETVSTILYLLESEVYLEPRSIDQKHLASLLKYAIWLLKIVFKNMPNDTDYHQHAIANFVILLSGIRRLCKGCKLAESIPHTAALLDEAEEYIIEKGKYSDSIAALITNRHLAPLPFSLPAPNHFFMLAEFIRLVSVGNPKSKSEKDSIDQALLRFETFLENRALELHYDIADQQFLPLLCELYFVLPRFRGLIEKFFWQHLSAFGFTQTETIHLFRHWVYSHRWIINDRPGIGSGSRHRKIREELHRIKRLHTIEAATPTILHRNYGLTHFFRYSERLLLEQVRREMMDPVSKRSLTSNPIAIIVSATDDHNRALDALRFQLDELDDATENIFDFYIVESSDCKALGEELEKLRNRLGRFSLMLISGHGTDVSIQLGKTVRVEAVVTIKDAFLGIVRNPKRFFVDGGIIILNSCSTAQQRTNDAKNNDVLISPDSPENIPHIAAALAASFGVKVIGPDRPASISHFEAVRTPDALPTIEVIYHDEKNTAFAGIVVPSK